MIGKAISWWGIDWSGLVSWRSWQVRGRYGGRHRHGTASPFFHHSPHAATGITALALPLASSLTTCTHHALLMVPLPPSASTSPQAFHSPCCALLPCPPASTSPPPTFHALSLFPCHSQDSAALEVAQLRWNGTGQRVGPELTAGPPRGGEDQAGGIGGGRPAPQDGIDART